MLPGGGRVPSGHGSIPFDHQGRAAPTPVCCTTCSTSDSVVFVKEVVVLSEGPWPLGNVGAELLERVCHPGGDDGQIRDRLGVADDSDVQLARVGEGADAGRSPGGSGYTPGGS